MDRIGVDIIDIRRIELAVSRWGQKFLDYVYTPAELELCGGRSRSLAARFAAKEAVMKALGTGFKGAFWRDIEVLADGEGRPLVRLSGRAKSSAEVIGVSEIAVSLSHSRDNAVAFAIAA
jgi:holo-[acyl-carrier protein] synthase